ncbi:MAG: hypothetical protein ABL911_11970 [Gallionella sp.]
MKGIVTSDEARTIAAIPKNLHNQLVWQKRNNHAGHWVAIERVEDADGAILPGLIVELECKAALTLNRCLFLYTLFTQRHGAKLRAYQLPEKRTHNESGNIIYGVHEHWGDKAIALQGFGCDDYSRGFEYFCRQINLTAIQLELP